MSPALCFTGGLLTSLLLFHQQASLSQASWMVGAGLALICLSVCLLVFIVAKLPAIKPYSSKAVWMSVMTSPVVFAGLLGAAVGWNHTLWQATNRLNDKLLVTCEGLALEADILVAELPNPIDIGVKWIGEVVRYEPTPQCPRLPSRLSMGWYTGFSGETAGPPPPVHVGEIWRLPIKLKRTVAPLQMSGFDVEAYWFANQIGATGTVQGKQAKQQSQQHVLVIDHRQSVGVLIEALREWLRTRMDEALQGQPFRGVIVALVLGDQKGISAEQWRLFSATGIGHLVSISGMHITLFAAVASWLVLLLWKRSARLCMWVPAPKVAAVAGFMLAMFYSLLAGWGVPAQRTVWMLGAVVLGVLIQSKPSPVHILSFAATLLMLLDPWCVLSAGFWLSFGAVVVLMYASVGRYTLVKQRWKPLREALQAQWVVTIGLTPITCLLFSQLSLISPLANAFAIPWVSFVVTPLAMLGAFTGWEWTLQYAHTAFAWVMVPLETMAQWSWATHPMAQPPVIVGLASVMGGLWILAPPGVPLKPLAWMLFTSLWWWPAERPAEGEVVLEFLDIGQGNAVAIQTRQHVLIYDTGPANNPQADSGSRVLAPWLNQHGIVHPDMLILSHQDSDHAGGAKTLMALNAPKAFSSSMDEEHEILQWVTSRAITHQPCRAGQRWTWDGVAFELLFPDDEDFKTWNKPNDTSCVLKVSTHHHSALLVGDIGIAQERALIERYGASLQSHLLLAPHHGSKTSSSEAFLDTVQPSVAVFQVGYRNRYGHPKQEVLERYIQREIMALRSDQTGAIRVHYRNTTAPHIEHAKSARQRYWHTPASPG